MKNLNNALMCSILMFSCIIIELYPSSKVLAKAFLCNINVENLIEATPKIKKLRPMVTEEDLIKAVKVAIGSSCINVTR